MIIQPAESSRPVAILGDTLVERLCHAASHYDSFEILADTLCQDLYADASTEFTAARIRSAKKRGLSLQNRDYADFPSESRRNRLYRDED